MAYDEEKREQIGKLIWIGIMVVATVVMGIFMLRNELHALISENEPLPPGVTAPQTPDAPPQNTQPANP